MLQAVLEILASKFKFLFLNDSFKKWGTIGFMTSCGIISIVVREQTVHHTFIIWNDDAV